MPWAFAVSRIRQISDELKQARKELEYCADIAQRSEQVRQNLYDLRHGTQPQTQRQHQRGHDYLDR